MTEILNQVGKGGKRWVKQHFVRGTVEVERKPGFSAKNVRKEYTLPKVQMKQIGRALQWNVDNWTAFGRGKNVVRLARWSVYQGDLRFNADN